MPSKQSSTVRLTEVAEAAGVSTATVSRVLGRSSHKVSPRTRKAVLDAARELGYRVNPIARALRGSSTSAVGVVVPSITNPFFIELVEVLEHELSARDLNLYLCDSRDDVEIEARRLRSLTGAVDGIIIVPCRAAESGVAIEDASAEMKVVQLDREVPHLHIPWVGVEDRGSMYKVMKHLRAVGVKTFGIVTSTEASLSSTVRTEAALAYGKDMGMTTSDRWILDRAYSIDEGIEAARVFAKIDLPDAIVCTDDIQAIGLVNGLERLGVSVPKDVLITGFDGIHLTSVLRPSITTVRQPFEDMAKEAVRLMTATEDGPDGGVRVAFPGKLCVRESTTRNAD